MGSTARFKTETESLLSTDQSICPAECKLIHSLMKRLLSERAEGTEEKKKKTRICVIPFSVSLKSVSKEIKPGCVSGFVSLGRLK